MGALHATLHFTIFLPSTPPLKRKKPKFFACFLPEKGGTALSPVKNGGNIAEFNR